ncbi:hypothetical protein RJ640_017541 [Escallonia rubra]|uniref:Pectinesterase inhibitor domain-containing protein n=1 Tax=Escallonia rubra TaxID=112253 RepID=A0AA88UKT5_9ASTE|nr:hypothetical protein RJ640_017541 [Escallonia rubra]
MNAGCLGDERVVSWHSMNATSDIEGRSFANSCTHKSPMWMHLRTWCAWYNSPNDGSATSRALPSLHRSQTWKNGPDRHNLSESLYKKNWADPVPSIFNEYSPVPGSLRDFQDVKKRTRFPALSIERTPELSVIGLSLLATQTTVNSDTWLYQIPTYRFQTICIRTLSTYADPAQTPTELAQTAVKVSLSRANKASSYLSTLRTSNKCEVGALSDCLSQISDTVDELGRTLSELKHLRSGTFRPPADISESSAAYQSTDRSLTPMPSPAISLKTKNKASPAHPSTTTIALKLKSAGSPPA